MAKANGRQAIRDLAEAAVGKKKLTDEQRREIYNTISGFRDWLVNEKAKGIGEANRICKKLYSNDIKSLAGTELTKAGVVTSISEPRMTLEFVHKGTTVRFAFDNRRWSDRDKKIIDQFVQLALHTAINELRPSNNKTSKK